MAVCKRKLKNSALEKYLDNQLNHHQRGDIENHLKGCMSCRRRVVTIKSLRERQIRMSQIPVEIIG